MEDSSERHGTLYVVGTPIGNLEDLSPRAVATLGICRLIAAEDTRKTRRLMTRHGLGGRVVSYHKFNEARRAPDLLAALSAGDSVALVSDAGTPGLSDPGSLLVSRARGAGHRVVPIPGPSAVTTLLSASGFPSGPFTFIGFLPSRRAARRSALEQLANEPRPLLFFEAPHRVLEMLDDLRAVLGERAICLGREMTKLHEEFLSGTIESVRERLAAGPLKGEISLLVAAPPARSMRPPEDSRQPPERPGESVLRLLAAGWDRKEALRRVAKESGLSRRQVYNDLLRAQRAAGEGGAEP
ncbi:MAG TPA: 16S rRNA (cytidine(1402)-2'-O)-methyltransferase [Candidatus Polarisedimenticolia bacterium]|nr:16S rRNA (cytidine(1402)-2'-O)-methyltransferase [Candidatus Polarisedimenticolia bacterium]